MTTPTNERDALIEDAKAHHKMWFGASKYSQVIFPTSHHHQATLDGFLAGVQYALQTELSEPTDFPPDEYDIAVDTGDGIYHTAELVHFQQIGSKRLIQAKLQAARATPLEEQKEEPAGWFEIHHSGFGEHYVHVSPNPHNESLIQLFKRPSSTTALVARNEALEEAAKIADKMPLNSNDDAHQYRFSDDCKAISWDIAQAIRALKASDVTKAGLCKPFRAY